MAAPIIDSIVIDPPTVAPGGAYTVKVNAHDPDGGTVNVTLTVTDKAGNVMTGTGTLTVADSLTFTAKVDAGSIASDTNDPSLFHGTAP